MTSLVREIRAAVRKDANVAVIPSVARPTGGAWYEGSDLRALAETAGIIEACFYEPSAARIRADIWDVQRRLNGAGKLRGILRPGFPDLQSRGEVVAAAEALRDAGIAEIAFYNYGHLRRSNLAWIADALEVLGELSVEFQGKVVAITGAAGGIGRELCRHFGGEGATIAALDRSGSLTAFAEELRGDGVRVESAVVDIGDAEGVASAFAKLAAAFGPVDILINNAGVSHNPSLQRTTPDGWRDDVNINLNGAYNCAHAVLPGHEGAARRRHRQYRLGERPLGARRPRLQRRQGGHDQPDQGAGAGIRPLQHPRQHRLAGHGAHADLGPPRRAQPGGADAAEALVSARPHRRADRGDARRRVPRLRRALRRSPGRCCRSIAG